MNFSYNLSFIIPCYRSQDTVKGVVEEIKGMVTSWQRVGYEIIVVNDSSPDGVLQVLKDLAYHDNHIKVIDLSKNMGKHAALMAGYSYASGDIIVCVDDDGQCPVDKLEELLVPLENGFDVSIAKYSHKKQTVLKNLGSKLNDIMANILINKPKDLRFSNFFAMRNFICSEILHYKNPYPYVEGLILRITNRVANVEMEERERASGTTGYTFLKSVSLWLNGFTAFSVKPLRIAAITGFFCALIGFTFGIYTIVHKILNPEILAGYSSLMAVFLLIGGLIMIILGLMGEYIGRIYICINSSPQYVIHQTINLDDKETKR